MKIELFLWANEKHNSAVLHVYFEYWLRALTNNLFSIMLPPEVLWRCCTTWSPGSLWSPSSPPCCEPSDLPPGSRYVYHLLLPTNFLCEVILSLNLFGVLSITQWVNWPLRFFMYHSVSYLTSSQFWVSQWFFSFLQCSEYHSM